MSGSYLQSLGLNQISPVVNSAPSSDDDLNDLELYTNSTFDFLDVDFGFGTSREGEGKEEETRRPEDSEVMSLFTAEDMFRSIPPLDVVPGPFMGTFDAGVATEAINSPNTTDVPPPPPPPPQPQPQPQSQFTPPTPVTSPVATAPKGRRRAASSVTNAEVSTEADEDKRRRNTAASARFRVKKKQHEQQLKDKAKELTEQAKKLEERIKKLEMENELLRSLIVEKNGGEKNGGGETITRVSEGDGLVVG